MVTTTTIDRDWLLAELKTLIGDERKLATDVKQRVAAPPVPELEVLYNEMAADDDRHIMALETIATRYGHTPTRSQVAGVGETLGRLTGQVAEIGSNSWDLVARDLAAKTSSMARRAAWVSVFETIGDDQSAGELGRIVADDRAHQDALQNALTRLLSSRVTGQP
jgi:hypothetical protein